MTRKGLVWILLALLFTLSGCSGGESAPVPCLDLAEAILSGQSFSTDMTQLSEKKLIKALDLPAESFAEAVMLLDASHATAEAVVVVTAADKAQTSMIADRLTAYRDSVLEQYRTYQPAEVPKLEAAKVITRGLQCVLVIAGDQEAAKKVCEAKWKAQ